MRSDLANLPNPNDTIRDSRAMPGFSHQGPTPLEAKGPVRPTRGRRPQHGQLADHPLPQPFKRTAPRTSAFRSASGRVPPSLKSMARTLLLSRRALKSLFGSFSWAPFGNVNRTELLSISPMHTMPSKDHTGTPSGLEGFFHLTTSSMARSAASTIPRSRDNIPPRQSPALARMDRLPEQHVPPHEP